MSSYQVIARKWRPALFDEIVGQEHVTRTLKNAIASGKTGQAYLFCGPRGVGKTTAARILAKSINCSAAVTPCNECESCKAIAASSSVDVIEIDGASNNGVDNVRELRESVRYMPSQGRRKVYIVDEVHMLSTAAFNALLKTLEEPPSHAVFILATTESHEIPATIISRCQRFDFRRILFKEIQLHLKKIVETEGIAFEEEALFAIAREADGSLRDAQSLLEQVAAYSSERVTLAAVSEALGLLDRKLLYDMSQAILERDGRICLNIVENIYNFGYDLKRVCAALLEHFRDMAVFKATGSEGLLDLPDAELARLTALASGVEAERLQMIFGIVSKGYEELGRASEPRYAFEMSLLRATHIEGLESIQSVITRLSELKHRVSSAQAAPVGQAGSGAVTRVQSAPAQVKSASGVASYNQVAMPNQAQATVEGEPSVVEPAVVDSDGLLKYIRTKKPSLVAALEGAACELGEADVEIVPAPEFVKFLESMHIDTLRGLSSEYLGKNIKIVIGQRGVVSGAPQTQSPVEPAVKDALRILGGKVIDDRRI
ncbi:MAG: DNA polymerase III, subunit gamma and tau [Deltaproteobacteria bacterium RIFCSPLOWO2_02_FULL_53_8]|nr:MAG: DNA polymerase III, subunit gamma and tau [Deltaproteobacteria bacterium RIFCSPLOWO2_02_FULL_53_8]